jgi:hypothetical protein
MSNPYPNVMANHKNVKEKAASEEAASLFII